MKRNRWGLFLLAGLLIAGAGLWPAAAQPAAKEATDAALAQVDLLAVGDWEYRDGNPPTTARAMADYAAALGRPLQAALLLGDSFHLHLEQGKEPQLGTIFEATYDPKRLNFPFYAIRGNHDCESDNTRIEMAYSSEHPDSRWKMPARWYRVDLPAKEPVVTILMLDSNKSEMPAKDWQAEQQWMETELAKPRGAWTLCAAHHPLFSNGTHGDSATLQREWGPILKKYRVDFYLNGHDHDLEHLEIDGWPTSFLVLGGGGGRLRADADGKHGPFSRSSFGFAHLALDRRQATVRIMDGRGSTVHEFVRQVQRDK
ncbi:MAG: metallophosphoesterase [Planctomycetota bacterium]|nr:metallophosphoesterase [Planctomycetota bacterium]